MKTFLFSLKFPKIWVGYVFFKWYFEKKWFGRAMGGETIYWDGLMDNFEHNSVFTIFGRTLAKKTSNQLSVQRFYTFKYHQSASSIELPS